MRLAAQPRFQAVFAGLLLQGLDLLHVLVHPIVVVPGVGVVPLGVVFLEQQSVFLVLGVQVAVLLQVLVFQLGTISRRGGIAGCLGSPGRGAGGGAGRAFRLGRQRVVGDHGLGFFVARLLLGLLGHVGPALAGEGSHQQRKQPQHHNHGNCSFHGITSGL